MYLEKIKLTPDLLDFILSQTRDYLREKEDNPYGGQSSRGFLGILLKKVQGFNQLQA